MNFLFNWANFLVNHVNWVVDFARKNHPNKKTPQQTAVAHLLEDSMLVAAQNDRSFTAHGLVHLKLFLPMNPLRLLAPRFFFMAGDFRGMSLQMHRHGWYIYLHWIGIFSIQIGTYQ